MATRVHGKGASVDYAGGSGTLDGITSWTMDIKGAADESTGMDSGGKKEFIGGLTEWSASLTGLYDAPPIETTPGSMGIWNFYTDDSEDYYYEGTGIVTSFKPDVMSDGVIKLTIEIQGLGSITYPVTPP